MCVNPKYGYPCGRCHECLARKTDSYIQKYFLEALSRKSMHFFTLTYDNEHLPFKVWDFACGEHNFLVSFNKSASAFMRSAYFSDSACSEHCPIPFSLDGDPYLAVPSLQRHDVVKWLKTFRKTHNFDFSYSFIGEYGKKGRPHYHGVVFGLDDDGAHLLSKSWKNGFTLVKSVPLVSVPGTSDVVSVSRYVAKYMHKGSFDDPKVLDGLVELPRVVSSLGLGSKSFDNMRDWYLGKDIYPDVDIMDKSFSDEYLDLVESRMTIFDIGSKKQYLSKFFKDKILKYDYTNPLSHETYKKSSNLSLALASRVQMRLKTRFEEKYSALLDSVECQQGLSEADVAAKISRFVDSERIAREDKERNSAAIHRKSLSKSKL